MGCSSPRRRITRASLAMGKCGSDARLEWRVHSLLCQVFAGAAGDSSSHGALPSFYSTANGALSRHYSFLRSSTAFSISTSIFAPLVLLVISRASLLNWRCAQHDCSVLQATTFLHTRIHTYSMSKHSEHQGTTWCALIYQIWQFCWREKRRRL